MAINKSVPTNFGVPATYFVVASISDNLNDKVVANLTGYASEAAFNAGSSPMCTRQVTLEGPIYSSINNLADLEAAITDGDFLE